MARNTWYEELRRSEEARKKRKFKQNKKQTYKHKEKSPELEDALQKIRDNLSKENKRFVLSPRKYRELREYVYERDNYCCVYCGSPEMPSMHHVKKRSQRGGDRPNNAVTMCIPCHIKIDKYEIELSAEVLEMLRNEPEIL